MRRASTTSAATSSETIDSSAGATVLTVPVRQQARRASTSSALFNVPARSAEKGKLSASPRPEGAAVGPVTDSSQGQSNASSTTVTVDPKPARVISKSSMEKPDPNLLLMPALLDVLSDGEESEEEETDAAMVALDNGVEVVSRIGNMIVEAATSTILSAIADSSTPMSKKADETWRVDGLDDGSRPPLSPLRTKAGTGKKAPPKALGITRSDAMKGPSGGSSSTHTCVDEHPHAGSSAEVVANGDGDKPITAKRGSLLLNLI